MKVVLKDLCKEFPSRTRGGDVVKAIDRFDLEIPDGKLVGLLGPSGCGKSTALNLISGLLAPSSGQIFFGEDDVTALPPENRGVGMVFQNYALYPHLTVEQNITFPLENLKGAQKLSREEMKARAYKAAELVQITQLMDRKPKEMSGGQQQRVAIARALVKTPRVLLMDEPLSNLDARLRLQTREEISRIQKETGVTTIFVTHDQDEAMSISDLIIVMRDGVIHQVGRPQEVYDRPVDLFVAQFLGTPPINCFTASIRAEKLCIGEEAVLDTPGLSDREVVAAIRPEGFIVDRNGPFSCDFDRVEVMGRDMSIVSRHAAMQGEQIRSIIDASTAVEPQNGRIRFRLKEAKVHIFAAESGERLDCVSGR